MAEIIKERASIVKVNGRGRQFDCFCGRKLYMAKGSVVVICNCGKKFIPSNYKNFEQDRQKCGTAWTVK